MSDSTAPPEKAPLALPSRGTLVAIAVVVGCVVLTYWNVLYWLIDDWDVDGNNSHGFVILPVALYLAWEKRAQLARTPVRPSVVGLLTMAVAIALLLLGTLAAETFVTRVSLVLTIVSIVWFAAGTAWVRVLWFPLAFLLLMIPIPSVIFNRIAFPLQLIASDFGARMLSMADIPVLREGNRITLEMLSLDVAEACSGIRSLVSLLTVSILYGYLTDGRLAGRAALIAATVPVAIAANGLRVAATGFAAHHFGAEAAEGFFHSLSGWFLFVIAAAGLVAIKWVIDLVLALVRDRTAGPLTVLKEHA